MLEKDIEQTVVNWAKEHGFLALKVTFTENGYPDRLFISPYGHTIFIEFKRPGEVPRALQSARIADLTRRGVPATWTHSAVEAINMLRACLESAPVPDAGSQAIIESGSGGAVLGPGVGEDLNLSCGIKDLVFQKSDPAMLDRSAIATDVQRVAGGDKEVGELQQLDLFDSPRWSEGSNACE